MIILGLIGIAWTVYRMKARDIRMKTELRAAHDAQMSIMPQSDPEIEGLDVSGICIPANEVGGDFFDYLWLNKEKTRFGIAIGDVSGKAMKSAMAAVMTNGMINSKADEEISVSQIMTMLNRPMMQKTDKNMFTALCLVSIDLNDKKLTFTNAGLDQPLLKSGNTVSLLESVGPRFPLGTVPDTIYQERDVQLKAGDTLVLYTDGLSETRDHSKALYGAERLKTLLETINTPILPASEIKAQIIADVQRFAKKARQFDDMTIVIVKLV